MNEKMLNWVYYPVYYKQIFNIHKQAEFTKNNGLVSSWDIQPLIFSSGNQFNQAFYSQEKTIRDY